MMWWFAPASWTRPMKTSAARKRTRSSGLMVGPSGQVTIQVERSGRAVNAELLFHPRPPGPAVDLERIAKGRPAQDGESVLHVRGPAHPDQDRGHARRAAENPDRLAGQRLAAARFGQE